MTWQPLYDLWLYALLAAGIVLLIVIARRIAVAPKQRSWLLLIPRLCVLLAVGALLLNPVERRQSQLPPQPASAALLVDCSKSMVLGRPESRLSQVQRAIDEATRRLSPQARPTIDLYRFGEHLAAVPGLAELSPADDASQLAAALERLPARFGDRPPRVVVVFSDGAVDSADRLPELAAGYANLGIEVHAFLPPEQEVVGDVGITDLAVPQRVTIGDIATIRTTISSSGYDGQRVVLEVRPADRPDVPAIATLPLTLDGGPQPVELVVQVDRDLGELAIQVPELQGEAVAENNSIRFRLTERSRNLKVLYMEGTVGTEYRWLQDALQEDSDIECVSMTVNNQYAARPTLQRIDDPYRGYPVTREELFEYDVVICSDISQASFTPEQIDWTVDLVANRGGGFAMIGGHTAFGSGGWDRTEWEKLVPFDMAGRRDYLGTGFNVRVPIEIESHPIWQIVDDPQQNRAVLDAMPAFNGTNLISRIKPAATLLGETAAPLPGVGVMPVFACETFGRGRTFAMSTDTTVDWGRFFESQWGEGDNRYYRKFWRNVVRWLAENSRASQRRLLVQTDRLIYSPGDPIRITAEAFDENLEPATGYRVAARLLPAGGAPDDATAKIPAIDLPASAALAAYTGELPARLLRGQDDPARPMQPVRLLVTAWDGDENVAESSIDLQLLHRSDEWLDPHPQPQNLQQLADAGNGERLQSSQQLAGLLNRFRPTQGETLVHTLPRWDGPVLWVVLLGLLGLEWCLRRAMKQPDGSA